MRPSMLLPALALSIAACANDAADTTLVDSAHGETAEAAEARIRELGRQWVAAIAAKDTAAIMNFYAPDARFMLPNAPAAAEPETIRSAWANMMGMPNVSITFEPTDVHVSDDGAMAYDIGTYRVSYDGPNGPVEDNGKYLVVWVKQGGEWKAVADMINTNLPADGS